MKNIRVTAESFPKPDTADVLNYLRSKRDFDLSQYSRVIELPVSDNPVLFMGQTALLAANQLDINAPAHFIVDGLDTLSASPTDLPEGSTLTISHSVPNDRTFSTCILLDSIAICPTPITAYSQIATRLKEIGKCLAPGANWWFVIPNELTDKLYEKESVRFNPSRNELPGNFYSKFAAQPETIDALASAITGTNFEIDEMWSVSGFLASPSSLTCVVGKRIGLSTADSLGTIMAYPFTGREALQTQAHLGPSASQALNTGWLIKATRTSEPFSNVDADIFASRSFADELHYYIHHDQVVDAGRILKAYYEQVILPAYEDSAVASPSVKRKDFNQRLVIHESIGFSKSISSLEDISRLIRADAFEQSTLIGDLPNVQCTRTWPASKDFINPISSEISPQTYLALELKLFLSRWVFPNPPKWIRGNLNDRQLIEHLVGLSGIAEREINWVEIDRVAAALPGVLSYPRGLEISGIGANLEWQTGLYISAEAHREYMQKIRDLKKLVLRWRRRLILNRAKSMGVDEKNLVLLYRKITRTGPQAPAKQP
jgi:hypothetical protein